MKMIPYLVFAIFLATGTCLASESPNKMLADDARVSCQGIKCSVEFQLGDGTVYQFEMSKVEEWGTFSENLTINRNDVPIQMVGQAALSQTYHSTRGLAAASIENASGDTFKLGHGIFVTDKHGIVEFERQSSNGRNLRTLKRSLYSRAYSTLSSNPILFYDPTNPGSCYPSDNIPQVAQVSVLVDAGFIESAIGTETDTNVQLQLVLNSIQDSFSFIRLIWSAQLNVRIQISHVEYGGSTSSAPLNNSPSTGCSLALDAYSQLNSYIQSRNNAVNWAGASMLLSKCFGLTDVAGVAATGAYCSGSGTALAVSDPVSVAHEMGHIFGSSHSFENGVGTTGGIMDVAGNGYYLGSPQFHPGRRSQVCGLIASLVQSGGCPFLSPSASGTCGDGILSPSEECECLPSGNDVPVTSCGDCQMCRTNGNLQCSTVSMIRQPTDVGHLRVSTLNAASPECCINGVVPVARSCNSGGDMCQIGGVCAPICRALGFTSCGVSASGCKQKCLVYGICVEVSNQLSYGALSLNSVADGTICYSVPGTSTLGTCTNGACSGNIEDDPGATLTAAPVTLPPTNNPLPPALPPTPRPTGYTSSPTLHPSRVTKRPTMFPTKKPTKSPSSTTLRPTLTTSAPSSTTSHTIPPVGEMIIDSPTPSPVSISTTPTPTTFPCANMKRKMYCNKVPGCVWTKKCVRNLKTQKKKG